MRHFIRGLFVVAFFIAAGAFWPIVGLTMFGSALNSDDPEADPLTAAIAWIIGSMLIAPFWVELAMLLLT